MPEKCQLSIIETMLDSLFWSNVPVCILANDGQYISFSKIGLQADN